MKSAGMLAGTAGQMRGSRKTSGIRDSTRVCFPGARKISVKRRSAKENPALRGTGRLAAVRLLSLQGKSPRTSVASATRPTARIIAPARGGT